LTDPGKEKGKGGGFLKRGKRADAIQRGRGEYLFAGKIKEKADVPL